MTRGIKENEQTKEAEILRLRPHPLTICVDWSTGLICAPEPIRQRGHVIPFPAPRLARETQINDTSSPILKIRGIVMQRIGTISSR